MRVFSWILLGSVLWAPIWFMVYSLHVLGKIGVGGLRIVYGPYGGFLKPGDLVRDPYDKGQNVFGSILGPLGFGNSDR